MRLERCILRLKRRDGGLERCERRRHVGKVGLCDIQSSVHGRDQSFELGHFGCEVVVLGLQRRNRAFERGKKAVQIRDLGLSELQRGRDTFDHAFEGGDLRVGRFERGSLVRFRQLKLVDRNLKRRLVSFRLHQLAFKRGTRVSQRVDGRLQAVNRRLRGGKTDLQDRARKIFEDCRDRLLLGFEVHLLIGQRHKGIGRLIERGPETEQLGGFRGVCAVAVAGGERESHHPEADAALGRATVFVLDRVKKLAQGTTLFFVLTAEVIQETVLSRGH